MLTATWSHSCLARRTSARWPACSAPMVGTRPQVPGRVARMARRSEMVVTVLITNATYAREWRECLWLARVGNADRLKQGAAEVEQDSQVQASRFQIRQHLSFVQVRQFCHGFQFQDDLARDDQVEPVCAYNPIPIRYFDDFLPHVRDLLRLKLTQRGCFINLFAESRPQSVVNCVGGFHDLVRQLRVDNRQTNASVHLLLPLYVS